MDLNLFKQHSETRWEIAPHGTMRVPAVIYADQTLIRAMDHKVYEQLCNVASLPGIVKAAYAMPDAHWGYGFPIGGVAAFDPDAGGVISAGGVGFDISCGVRTLHTGLHIQDIQAHKTALAEALYYKVPAGVGSTGNIHLSIKEMDAMLQGGARWAVQQGYGHEDDLSRIEEHGCMSDAQSEHVSDKAKQRQRNELGTLGSGNHYLEVQYVTRIDDQATAGAYGIREGDVVVSIHCGSRGLGHQIGTEFLKAMAVAAPQHGITLPDRGSMGTESYILAGTPESEQQAFSSACHGAGRAMSRHQATRQWRGRALVDELAGRGIIIKSPSLRGVAEEAPGAYKDVSDVVQASDRAGLARQVARLAPLIVIKG